MGLLDIISGNSVWRGIDYFNNNKVLKYKKINEAEFDGIIVPDSLHTLFLILLLLLGIYQLL